LYFKVNSTKLLISDQYSKNNFVFVICATTFQKNLTIKFHRSLFSQKLSHLLFNNGTVNLWW